jgi:hypothetical protein
MAGKYKTTVSVPQTRNWGSGFVVLAAKKVCPDSDTQTYQTNFTKTLNVTG